MINFIGIGVERSGTCWLHKCLSEHPEVFMPYKKELFFFNSIDPHYLKYKNPRFSFGIEWYLKNFKEGENKIKGEYTPTYLYEKKAAERIKYFFPDIKLICILRDPVERLFSDYYHTRRIGLIENIKVEEAIQKYPSLIEKGLYSKYLKYYYDIFPKENILVLRYKDIKNRPKELIKECYKFLNLIDIEYVPYSLDKKINVSSKSIIQPLNTLMSKLEYYLRDRNYYKLLKFLEDYKIRDLAIKIRDLNSFSFNSKNKNINEKLKCELADFYEEDQNKLFKYYNSY